jgi:hypothetical protein
MKAGGYFYIGVTLFAGVMFGGIGEAYRLRQPASAEDVQAAYKKCSHVAPRIVAANKPLTNHQLEDFVHKCGADVIAEQSLAVQKSATQSKVSP